MKKGELVPDEVVIGLVRERLKQKDAEKGFILDGFPANHSPGRDSGRNLKELGKPVDAVLKIEVSRETLIERLTGRRSCKVCGTGYNVNTGLAPKKDGFCDKCGGEVIQRADDNRATHRESIECVHQRHGPPGQFYEKKGRLQRIPCEGPLDEVLARFEKAALAAVGRS